VTPKSVVSLCSDSHPPSVSVVQMAWLELRNSQSRVCVDLFEQSKSKYSSRLNTPGEMNAHDCLTFNASVNVGPVVLTAFVMKHVFPVPCNVIS
jgi:hypothetical protein